MTFLHRADVYALMRKAILTAGGQSAWAAQVGVSPQYVCDVVNGRRDPGKAILEAMGLEKVEGYRMKGERG